MATLVTGAGGFIGRNVTQALAQQGYEPIAATSRNPNIFQGIETFPVDNIKELDWRGVLARVGAVVHLAGTAHNKRASWDEFRRVNLDATRNLISQAVDCSVPNFIYLSSVAVYGHGTASQNIDDNTLPAPDDYNGESKLLAEQELQRITRHTDTTLTVLRVPMVYGPQAPGNFGKLAKAIRWGLPLPIANATRKRNFLAVQNLVSAFKTIINFTPNSSERFLLCDLEAVSSCSLANQIGEIIGRRPVLYPVPERLLLLALKMLGNERMGQSLFGQSLIDPKYFMQNFSWYPPVSLDAALDAAFRYSK